MVKSSNHKQRRNQFRQAIEALEVRQMLSATVNAGILAIDGTAGNDAITVSTSGTTINVDVNGTPQSFDAADPMNPVSSIVVHGLAGNDTIDLSGASSNITAYGDGGDDVLISGAGNDYLDGGDGNDTFKFRDHWGQDIINESPTGGTDTMDFSACTGNLLATIGALQVTEDGNVANHGASAIENIIGGSGNDTFLFTNGSSLAGTIDGGAGINTLDYAQYTTPVSVDLASGTATGTGGVQHISNLIGGTGNDLLIGDANANVLNGGPGVDTLNGNGGADTFVLGRDAGSDVITAPAGSGAVLDFSGFTSDLTFSITSTGVIVTSGTTVLANVAGNGVSKLIGGSGNDTFFFLNGATFSGTIDGGAGTNTLNYSFYTTPVTANLLYGTATGTQGVSNIANIIGGEGNDLLVGDNNANVLRGGGGNDVLYGQGGNDSLYGDNGNDILVGQLGNDLLDGGIGRNILIGDAGADVLTSPKKHEDILVAGTYKYETKAAVLALMLKEWSRPKTTYTVRAQHMTGTPGGYNKKYFFSVKTVKADATASILSGGSGRNVYIARTAKKPKDSVRRKAKAEMLVQI